MQQLGEKSSQLHPANMVMTQGVNRVIGTHWAGFSFSNTNRAALEVRIIILKLRLVDVLLGFILCLLEQIRQMSKLVCRLVLLMDRQRCIGVVGLLPQCPL